MSVNQQGVTYIKINRIDNEGNDNTLTLQGLTNIRIKYSDIGVKDYPIYTIAEYPNYYLYQLYTTDITSSTNNSILNYTCEATASSLVLPSYTTFPPALVGPFNEVTDVRGYYDNSRYNFQNTPNIPLTFSFSGTASNTAVTFRIINNSGVNTTTLASTGGNILGEFSLTYSGYFSTNDVISIAYTNDIFSPGSTTITNALFQVTQSISPTSSINQVILEPYVTENFEFSDCNVLYGNVDSYPFNPFYMDVDYSTNGMIAINTNQIISGSATRSTVKPYYYSLNRHIIPRYEGSKNTDKGVFYFRFAIKAGINNGQWSLYIYPEPGDNSFDNVSKLKQGDTINIYQSNGNPVQTGTIIRISLVDIGPGSTYYIIDIPTPSTNYFYNTLLPVKKIDYLFTGSGGFDIETNGIAYLTPNTYEDSNIFPIDIFNSNIFEYKYGSTTFPEIPNASMLVMGNILEVADQNNVNILQQDSLYYEAYNKIISDNFTPNTNISDIRQYGDGKQVTLNNLKVITSDFGTPVSPLNAGEITEYWLPTSNLPEVDFGAYASVNNDDTIIFYNNLGDGGVFGVQLNELGQYITGSLISTTNLANNISSSLQAGERWFVTFYKTNELPNPLDKTSAEPLSLINYNIPPQYRQSGTDAQLLLAARGIAEITSASFSSGSSGQILPTCRLVFTPSSQFGDPNFGGTNFAGLILWKATIPSAQQGKYTIIDKPAGNNLGPGAIVPPDSNNAINQYFNKITTTYGANTKPPTN